MKQIYKKTLALGLSLALAAGAALSTGGAAVKAAADGTSDYNIVIPATLSVQNAGWNALDGGITAKGSLETGKKLVVSASSANSWKLVSDENNVGYNLAATGDNTSVYSATAEAPTWEFTELTTDGTSQTAGIIVEDYSTKPAGTYQDTVTFTAKVETAKQQHSFTLTGPYTGETLVVEYYEGDTWNDMVAKYPNTLKVLSGYVAFGGDGFIYPKNGRMIPATTQLNPNETYEVQ